jgi:hypothetical protein
MNTYAVIMFSSPHVFTISPLEAKRGRNERKEIYKKEKRKLSSKAWIILKALYIERSREKRDGGAVFTIINIL